MDDLFDFLLARQSGGGGGFAPLVAPKDALLFYSSKEIGISIKNGAKNWDGTLYYSTDHSAWNEWDGTTEIVSALNNGWHKIYLRGVSNTRITGTTAIDRGFAIRGSSVECKGNCNNLLDYTTIPKLGQRCFYGLFRNCTSLVSAPALPATTLADSCYTQMFAYCTSLTSAPALPATTLANSCYPQMFAYCTSLTSAPALPATTLTSQCYQGMFDGCAKLITAPALPATTLAFGCYANMFAGCVKLTTAPALPATTLANSCYINMFAGCVKLTTAPALPATQVLRKAYENMFKGCTSIKLSTTQEGEYQNEYRIPISGEGVETTGNDLTDMFADTGGTFVGTPTINTTYYTSNTVINP